MKHYRLDGPIAPTLRPTEHGADIDATLYLIRVVFVELFAQAAEDPEGFGEEFAAMHELALSAQTHGPDSHPQHAFDALMEGYLAKYADDGRIRLSHEGVRQMRDGASEIAAPRPVPGQRTEGGAAA
jgi:hypothetical protein